MLSLINLEVLEDYFLLNEAEKRLGHEDVNFISEADLISSLEISEEELQDVEN